MSTFNSRLRRNTLGVTNRMVRGAKPEEEKGEPGPSALPGKKGCRKCDFTGHLPGDTESLSAPAALHPALKLRRKRSMGMPLELPVSYRILTWRRCPNCMGQTRHKQAS